MVYHQFKNKTNVRYDNKQHNQKRKRITPENEKRTEQTKYVKTISPMWKKKRGKVPLYQALKGERESAVEKKRNEKERMHRETNKEMMNVYINK